MAGRLPRLLASIGWRTRVSEVRRHYWMTIENRQYKRGRYTVSEYRYLPAVCDDDSDAA